MKGIFVPGMDVPDSCFLCHFVFSKLCPVSFEKNSHYINDHASDGRLDGCPLVCVCYSGLNEV